VTAPVESEIKLEMTGPEAARQRVRGLGATLTRPRHFEDNLILDDAARSLAARGLVLRLRRTDAGAVLTYKGPRHDAGGVKSRPEIETGVSSADAAQALLEGLGFRPVFRYQKYRETYRWGGVEIVVDETPLGTFLEIEGPVAEIHDAARALGHAPADYVLDSYASLFFARGGQGDMVFP
jgi:adenylate cyclase class 2